MDTEPNLGGRHRNTLIIGKIYADWCGHCIALMPEWKKLKNRIKHQSVGNVNVIFKELGDTKENKAKGITVDSLIQQFNAKNKANQEKLKVDGGFPTIFKIYNGKLEYYKGARDADSMYSWVSGHLKSGHMKHGFSNNQTMRKPDFPVAEKQTFFGRLMKNIVGGSIVGGSIVGGSIVGGSRRKRRSTSKKPFLSRRRTSRHRVKWADNLSNE
jgi:thiol-disulfide isomerase/thioredoxin